MTTQNAIDDVELDKVQNLADLPNRQTALTNLGFGDPSVRLITDADFSGGFLTLTNPCAQYFAVDVVTPGLVIKLPPAQDTPSYIAFALVNGPNIINVSTTISFDIQLSDGTFFATATPGIAGDFLLIDNSTVAGTWIIKPFLILVNGKSGIVTLTGNDIDSTYTPVNYTPSSSTIDGNLQGIDVALDPVAGPFLVKANNLSDVANVQTSVYNLFPGGQAYDLAVLTSLNFDTRVLNDSAELLSLDWGNRATFNSLGNLTIGWDQLILNDDTGTNSIDWGQRNLEYPDGTTHSLNWRTSTTYDQTNKQSINWNLRELTDVTEVISIDWNARQLFASNGTTVAIDYSDINQIIFSTFQGTEFAIVPGAAPVVNYFTVNGAPTGNTPILNSIGSDLDVGMTFQVQGAGNYDFTSTGNGGLLGLIQPGGVIANSFNMFSANTGNAPVFSVGGSDTDVSMQLQAQGAGVIFSNQPIHADGGFTANDASALLSIDANNRHLVDVTGAFGVVDWQFGQLDLPIAGNPPVVDWFSMQLNDQTTTLSADWSQRYLYDTSGNLSLEWGNRFAFDSTGQYAIDWQNRALFDTSSVETLGWGTRTLIDAASQQSANWNLRSLFNSSGSTTVAWQAQQLNDSGGNLSHDWDNRQLVDEVGALAINYTAAFRNLLDASSNLSMDWRNRFLYDSSGVNVSIDYQSKHLNASGAILSQNWNTRQLFANDGTTIVADWSSQLLNDSTGTLSVLWNTRRLYDAGGINFTLDWASTRLADGLGNTSAEWTGRTLNNLAGNSVLNWASSTMYDVSAVDSITWGTRKSWDSLGVKSEDWDARNLFASNGTTVALDYSNSSGIGIKGLKVAEGANAKQGIATLVAGTVTVANTSVTANSRIFYNGQDTNVTGWLSLSKNVGVGFTITSSVNTDTGVVAYLINEPV